MLSVSGVTDSNCDNGRPPVPNETLSPCIEYRLGRNDLGSSFVDLIVLLVFVELNDTNTLTYQLIIEQNGAVRARHLLACLFLDLTSISGRFVLSAACALSTF